MAFPKILDGMEMRQNSASDQWCGRATIASGDTTVTVSQTTVKSDALIFATAHLPIASHHDLPINILSLVDGSYVTFGVALATSEAMDFNWFAVRNLTT
jgi:nitrogen fixation protein FixH